MCSRYSLTSSPEEIRRLVDYLDRPNFPPRDEIFPSEPIGIVVRRDGRRRFMLARWGFVAGWMKDDMGRRPMINARIETAAEKPSFRGAMRYRRCLVPADSFFEWSGEGRGRKIRHRIRPVRGGPFAMAGIFDTWMASDGSESDGVAILTRDANADVVPIHDRMPVIVEPRLFDAWLDTDAVKAEDAVARVMRQPDIELVLDPPAGGRGTPADPARPGPAPRQMGLFDDED